MKQAMVFAAGLGTRLRPLTDTMPKALVPVGGRTLLEHVVTRLDAAGYTRIVVNVHHFAEQIVAYVDAHDRFGLDLRISDEQGQLLETGGGLRHAAPLFEADTPVLVHNVDILSDLDFALLERAYAMKQAPDALLAVSRRRSSRHLVFDDEDRLCGWENTATGETKGRVWTDAPLKAAFAGIHMMHPRLFPLMVSWPERFSIIDFYLHCSQERHIVGWHHPDLHLLDVGKIDALAEAENFIGGRRAAELRGANSPLTANR